jgi:hypothetical protein
MAEPSLQLGNGNWAGKSSNLLAYHKVDTNFYADELTFTRASTGTIVNSDGLIEQVATNVPRIDYLNNAKGSLLLEPQRTNAITNSYSFGSTGWSFVTAGSAISPIITDNYAISPDGTQNAQRVQFNLGGGTTSSDRTVIRQLIGSQTDWFLSVWMKSTNGTNQEILWHSDSDSNATVVTGEWQRFDLSKNGVTNAWAGLGLRGSVSTVDTADILVWGFQAELGSYATSYIPTSGTSVTRIADTSSTTGLSGVIGQTEGTMLIDVVFEDGDNTAISISDGSNNNRVQVSKSGANFQMFSQSGGAVQANIVGGTFALGRHKVLVSYAPNDYRLYINGVLIGEVLSAITFSGALSIFTFGDSNNSPSLFGRVNSIILTKFSTANAEAIQLTTI